MQKKFFFLALGLFLAVFLTYSAEAKASTPKACETQADVTVNYSDTFSYPLVAQGPWDRRGGPHGGPGFRGGHGPRPHGGPGFGGGHGPRPHGGPGFGGGPRNHGGPGFGGGRGPRPGGPGFGPRHGGPGPRHGFGPGPRGHRPW